MLLFTQRPPLPVTHPGSIFRRSCHFLCPVCFQCREWLASQFYCVNLYPCSSSADWHACTVFAFCDVYSLPSSMAFWTKRRCIWSHPVSLALLTSYLSAHCTSHTLALFSFLFFFLLPKLSWSHFESWWICILYSILSPSRYFVWVSEDLVTKRDEKPLCACLLDLSVTFLAEPAATRYLQQTLSPGQTRGPLFERCHCRKQELCENPRAPRKTIFHNSRKANLN